MQTNTLNYILDNLLPIEYFTPGSILQTRMPVEIPNFGRNQLADLFRELNFTVGAEIGVEQGEYSEILLKANPELMLFGIDAWKAYRGYRDHTRQEKLDRFYEITQKRLKNYNVQLIRQYSMDAVKQFQDDMLDFVYIDGNHNFLHATQDIFHWSKKVRPGGIVAGHDYIKRKEPTDTHVYQVLNGFTDAYHINPWFVLGTQAKIEGQIRDDVRSWMYVKI